MSTGDPMCMLHGRLIPCADCVARSVEWIPVRNYGDTIITPCENCSTALSQRDRWHSEAKRIGDNYEQAVRDLDAMTRERDEQRAENSRLMSLLGDSLREIERMRPVYEAAIECHRGESIVIDYQQSCPLCRDRDAAPTCDAHAQYAHAATAATEQLGIAIDAATTKPEAGE